MKLLLDTCCWLWWLSDVDKLSRQQRERDRQSSKQTISISSYNLGIKH